jgi:hypothetical protein
LSLQNASQQPNQHVPSLESPREKATLRFDENCRRTGSREICGVTNASDANAAFDAGADLLGFNTNLPGTKRYVDLAANTAGSRNFPCRAWRCS